MTKLATVTALRPRDEHASVPDERDSSAVECYWERMQALRAELALLDGVG